MSDRSRRRGDALSLPNLLTYGRIAAIPLIVVLLQTDARWTALLVFAAASITDFLDGWLARRFDLGSDLGRLLDPIADKLLVAALLLALAADGTIAGASLWAAMIILCREVAVAGLREFLAERGSGAPVTPLAKWKTGVQLVALGCLIAPLDDPAFGLGLLWIAAGLTLYTGYDYFKIGLRRALNGDS